MSQNLLSPFRSYLSCAQRSLRVSQGYRRLGAERLEDRRMLAHLLFDFNYLTNFNEPRGFLHRDGFSVQGVDAKPLMTGTDDWVEQQGMTIHQTTADAWIRFFRRDGGNFRFLAIDLNSLHENLPSHVPFEAVLDDGGTSQFTFITDSDLATFQGFTSPVSETMTRLHWQQADPGGAATDLHQFDNILVEVGPSVVATAPDDTNIRFEAAASFEVTFNEEIDLASFTYEDLILNRNGAPVQLDGSVTMAHVDGNTYRIEGLTEFTQPLGDYSLTIEALNILSPTGLQGMGSHEQSWIHAEPLTIAATTPALEGGTVAELTSLDLSFSGPALGADQAEHYELRRAGADGLLGTDDDPIISLDASYAGTMATLHFSGLTADIYRLTVRDAITDIHDAPLDGNVDGAAGGDWRRDFVVGAITTPLESPGGYRWDLAHGGYGVGQFIDGTGNVFDGANRLIVDGETVSETSAGGTVELQDDGQTYASPSIELTNGLEVHRKVTVPAIGDHDFARTVDTFTNPTEAPIHTTIRVAVNLGSDGRTTVFGTSSGDAVVERTDRWIGTDGGGAPAVIHYLRGPAGTEPSNVQAIGDNLFWEYDLTLAPGETVRLAHFTLLAATRQAAEAAAATLITPTGFGGQAMAHLTPPEIDSLANFRFNTSPWAADDEVTTNENTALLIDLLADNGHGPDGDAEGNLEVSQTVVTIPPSRGTLTNHGNGTVSFDPGSYFDFLAAGQSTTESFTYQVQDALGEIATAVVTITVHGVNDKATISGTLIVATDEDTDEPLTGQLLVADLDTGENRFVPQVETAGVYGTFSLQEDGAWSYALDGAAVQHLSGDDSVTETFEIQSADGTATEVVSITIAGMNDAPTAEIVSVSEMPIAVNEIIVTAVASDFEDAAESLVYQFEVRRVGNPLPVAQQSGVDSREFRFTPEEAGEYLVTLMVTDLDDQSTTVQQSITVGGASQVELTFSKTLATVGTIDTGGSGSGAGPTTWFHEWEDATAELWITLETDLPETPVDLSLELVAASAWLAAPQVLDHLGDASWETHQEEAAARTTLELRGMDLSGYAPGDRVLIATLIFPQNRDNLAGIAMDQVGAYPEPVESGVELTKVQQTYTARNLDFQSNVPGRFVPVIYDADDNGGVGLSDFAAFVSRFGLLVDETTPDAHRFDYDGDQKVGLSDFVMFVQNFGAKKGDPHSAILLPDWLISSVAEPPAQVLALPLEPEPTISTSPEQDQDMYLPMRLLGEGAVPTSMAPDRVTATVKYEPLPEPVSLATLPQPYPGAFRELDPRIVDALWESASYDALTEEEIWVDEDASEQTANV